MSNIFSMWQNEIKNKQVRKSHSKFPVCKSMLIKHNEL